MLYEATDKYDLKKKEKKLSRIRIPSFTLEKGQTYCFFLFRNKQAKWRWKQRTMKIMVIMKLKQKIKDRSGLKGHDGK